MLLLNINLHDIFTSHGLSLGGWSSEYVSIQLFAHVCAYYKSTCIRRIIHLNLVTLISRQPLLQLTNGFLHLGHVISEQHPYHLETWFFGNLHHGEIPAHLAVIIPLNIIFSTTSISIGKWFFVFWPHCLSAAPSSLGKLCFIVVCTR